MSPVANAASASLSLLPIVMKSLAAKALVGFATRILLFGLLLFIPAWSVDFWQGWTVLALFVSCQLPTVVYFLRKDPRLVERRLKSGAKAEGRPRQKIIIELIKISAALLFVTAGFDHRFKWSQMPIPLVIAADCGLVLGIFIQFQTFKENSFASAVITILPEQRLIATGPYAIVRHPMYLGGMIVNLCTPIALGSWWAMCFALLWLGAIRLRVLDEEKLLCESLPGYEDYSRKVRHRLVPRIW